MCCCIGDSKKYISQGICFSASQEASCSVNGCLRAYQQLNMSRMQVPSLLGPIENKFSGSTASRGDSAYIRVASRGKFRFSRSVLSDVLVSGSTTVEYSMVPHILRNAVPPSMQRGMQESWPIQLVPVCSRLFVGSSHLQKAYIGATYTLPEHIYKSGPYRFE
jgi:hypothetical protein